MKRLALALAASAMCDLATPLTPLHAAEETAEAVAAANDAAAEARAHMYDEFGAKLFKPGQFVWKTGANSASRVVVSLSQQMAYVYRGDDLVAVTTVSSGKAGNDTPTGIFPILEKKVMHRSRKYDNAPMPFMQRLDNYGIALHAGHNPGYAASHGCIRLPAAFAKKLFSATRIGTTVMIAS